RRHTRSKRDWSSDVCSSDLDKAYQFAFHLHQEQKRKSGEPYIIHPIQVAGILAELHMDPDTVVAGYLHDVVEDTTATLADVEQEIGRASCRESDCMCGETST